MTCPRCRTFRHTRFWGTPQEEEALSIHRPTDNQTTVRARENSLPLLFYETVCWLWPALDLDRRGFTILGGPCWRLWSKWDHGAKREQGANARECRPMKPQRLINQRASPNQVVRKLYRRSVQTTLWYKVFTSGHHNQRLRAPEWDRTPIERHNDKTDASTVGASCAPPTNLPHTCCEVK